MRPVRYSRRYRSPFWQGCRPLSPASPPETAGTSRRLIRCQSVRWMNPWLVLLSIGEYTHDTQLNLNKLEILFARSAFGTHPVGRSEEHTSELQSLMRISYAVFCLKKKKKTEQTPHNNAHNDKTTKKST